MNNKTPPQWFNNIETIIDEPLKFKEKLAIGEDAYTSLRVKNSVFEAWDTLGVAATAASVAQSTTIASTFFAPTGFLAAIGIGTAVTPIGWVVAASVVTGGAWLGATRYLKKGSSDKTTVIPKFINTPVDVLALALFDMLAPLALKVAEIDGHIHNSERDLIHNYFVKEWGYNSDFVCAGLSFTEGRLSEYSVKELAEILAEYKRANPDCNYESMSQEILSFLRNIMHADGVIDEREEMAIEKAEAIFKKVNQFSLKQSIEGGWNSIMGTITDVKNRN